MTCWWCGKIFWPRILKVSALLRGQVEADELIHDDPAAGKAVGQQHAGEELGQRSGLGRVECLFQETTFTNDPTSRR